MKNSFLPTSLFAIVALNTLALSTQASSIINGAFEAGNTGFSSSYQYTTPGGSNLWPESLYTVDSNPINSHGLFYSMGDHTTGSGLFMIINGSGTTGIPIWQGTVSSDLTIGAEYDFSAWMASVHPASPAELTFKVDGVSLGTYSPTTGGDWTRQFASFTATQSRPVFEVINSNGNLYGNDFALDDIDVFARNVNSQGQSSVPDNGPGILGIAATASILVANRMRNPRK
jgi:hypothetical protein